MQTEALEQWRIRDFDPGAGAASCAISAPTTESGWVTASAPGDTHAALMAVGRLADPFRGNQECDAAWVATREWWWRSTFTCPRAEPGEQVELVFDGLDTFATIHLNGERLGCCDNMFRRYRFEVGRHLSKDGRNVLTVVFSPADVPARELNNWGQLFTGMADMKRNLMRKAQFGWGWDWGPNLPTVGVWKAVRIERWRKARIEALSFATLAASEALAEVSAGFELSCAPGSPVLRCELQLLAPDGALAARRTLDPVQATEAVLIVTAPQRWWTSDLGAQPLYTLKAELFDGDTRLDVQQRAVGIRTLTLDTSADAQEAGTDFFRFVLNGVPIFARGANWIPADSFVGTLGPPRYRELLESALRANMNMLRVWGGGIYEHDAFYSLCDELGLLVWQDFMFACAAYPEDDPRFVASVQQEVRDQVRRLRHHPSLALWCGNNECQLFQFMADHISGRVAPLPGALYYDRLLPEALAELDPHTAYWPGSPSGGPSANSMRAGDVHDWTVWHGLPPVPDRDFAGRIDRSPSGVDYRRYAENSGRFISEFGIHAGPAMTTLRRWLDADDLRLDSAAFLNRIKDDPKNKIDALMEPLVGMPATLQQYVDFTMLTQAEGLKFGLEHFRRRKPHCSGTLIWQYNDCWPCVSWSLIDYDGTGKAGFHAVARAYAPVLASFKPLADDTAELWIVNDGLSAVSGAVQIDLVRLQGACEASVSLQVDVPANCSTVVWRGHAPTGARDRALCVHSPDGLFPANRLMLAPIKSLQLAAGAKPRLDVVQSGPCSLHVRLAADAYLLFVQLVVERPGMRYSDNYFDLRAGEVRDVIVTDPHGPISPCELAVTCWNETQLPRAAD
ncbi:beta-mannosidase [Solimonas terrae]|uniref:Beta-mannosidase B n=1 Tax=Solimonas terrae TaxID=1396819 RepID=A0A6M2BSL1_9GAMM|nr:glycoside hydrolase family 2 protein [Solimonas terrae]NGY05576.1 glycoside hydrolase family 2 protein [Solimonas terrae]